MLQDRLGLGLEDEIACNESGWRPNSTCQSRNTHKEDIGNNMSETSRRSLRRLLAYPGWLDLVVVATLHVLLRPLLQEVLVAIAIVISTGVIRYSLAYFFVGICRSSSRNWYVKLVIYVAVSIAVAVMYSPQDFVWKFGIYFATLFFLEIIVTGGLARLIFK